MAKRSRSEASNEGEFDRRDSANLRLVAFVYDISGKYEMCSVDFADPVSENVNKLISNMDVDEGPLCRDFIGIGTKIYMVEALLRNSSDNALKVFVYDTLSGDISEGPSLKYNQNDVVIVSAVGNKMFAFPDYFVRMNEFHGNTTTMAPTLNIEMLDTSSSSEGWVSLPITVLPPPADGHLGYSVAGVTTSSTTLLISLNFISIKQTCSLAYEVASKSWKYSKHSFPFNFEAKFVDGVFFCFPQGRDKLGYIGCYKIRDGDKDNFWFEEIKLYPYVHPYFRAESHFDGTYMPTLLPVTKDIVFVIRGYVDNVSLPPGLQKHGVIVEKYKLGRAGKSTLLWDKFLPVAGEVEKWLFM